MNQPIDLGNEILPQPRNMLDEFLQKTIAAHYMIAAAVIVVLCVIVLYMWMQKKEKATDFSGALGSTSMVPLQKQEQVGLQPGTKNDALASANDVAFDLSITNPSVPYETDTCNSASGYNDEAYAWLTSGSTESMMVARKEKMANVGLSDYTLSAALHSQ